MKKIFFLILILVFLSFKALEAQTSIKAEVNKTNIAAGEPLIYKVTVISAEEKLSPLIFSEFKGFKIISKTQSSSISVTKGKARSILAYRLVLIAQEPGKFVIDPASIKIGASELKSESFEIEVKPGKVKAKPRSSIPRIIPDASQATL